MATIPASVPLANILNNSTKDNAVFFAKSTSILRIDRLHSRRIQHFDHGICNGSIGIPKW